jgi:nicotinate dehydrogenase subunit B
MRADKKAPKTVFDPVSHDYLARRDFIKTLGGGIVVIFSLDGLSLSGAQESRGRGNPSDLNAYLRIDESGKVTVFSGKIEMGQGVMTSLAQMAADELEVPLSSVEMIMGDTDVCPYDMGTFGSMSTRFFGPPLRGAAAEAKAVLLELGSEQLKTPKEQLSAEDGFICVAADKKNRISYGRLARGQTITRRLDAKITPKPLSGFRIMGKSEKRLDARAKVTGEAKYAGDIRLPDMLYARILRPPVHGATLKNVDTTAAEKMPGVIVVNQDGLVAALHQDPEAAAKALESMRPQFDAPKSDFDNATIFDHLMQHLPPVSESEKRGDLAEGQKLAAEVYETRYFDPYLAHASIETHTALAKFEAGKMTVWAATQTPFPNQQQIARILSMPAESVRVITPFVGGGFGGKSSEGNHAVEAARLAKITGKPVQVAYTRAEEFFYDAFRPAAIVKIKSGTDRAGKICLWDYSVYFAGSRGIEQYYDFPHNICRVYGGWNGDPAKAHPFGTGPWRGPGANTNCFARESQIDIMAAKQRIDPLEFRLNHTSDKRMRSVLEAAANRFGYRKGAGPTGRGVGMACGIDAGTYVAEIAEVQADKATGKIKVKRIVCAQEMGIVINPEGATMQMEGCITMGLGYTLSEEVHFRGGEVLDRNFDTYELPRFSWLPQIETILVKNDELSPQGGGEPAIVCVGAAVANAVYDSIGVRCFQLPLTPERVKAAIASTRA